MVDDGGSRDQTSVTSLIKPVYRKGVLLQAPNGILLYVWKEKIRTKTYLLLGEIYDTLTAPPPSGLYCPALRPNMVHLLFWILFLDSFISMGLWFATSLVVCYTK